MPIPPDDIPQWGILIIYPWVVYVKGQYCEFYDDERHKPCYNGHSDYSARNAERHKEIEDKEGITMQGNGPLNRKKNVTGTADDSAMQTHGPARTDGPVGDQDGYQDR